MKPHSRTIRTAVLVAALAVALAGCANPSGGNASGDENNPQLLIWVDSVREPAAKAYQASVAGEVDVSIEVVDAGEVQTKISLLNTTGSGWPDVLFAGTSNDIAKWAHPSDGYAANLSEALDPAVLEGFNGTNEWCNFDGTYYCLKTTSRKRCCGTTRKCLRNWVLPFPPRWTSLPPRR